MAKPPPPPPDPVYTIPLTDDELIVLGRITAVWAHVEFALDKILVAVHGIDHGQLGLFVGDKQIGAKAAMFRQSLPRITDAGARGLALAACEAVSAAIGDRNLAAHGMWGFDVHHETRTTTAAAYSMQKHVGLFPSRRLPDLYKRVVAASAAIDAAQLAVEGRPPEPRRNRKFLFGKGPPPDWL